MEEDQQEDVLRCMGHACVVEEEEEEDMKVGYMAVGNYGTTHHLHDPDKPPRAQLLQKCHCQHCDKMYCDTKDGKSDHIGYIVAGEWFTIYEVHEWSGNS